jgi:hypothetical protein
MTAHHDTHEHRGHAASGTDRHKGGRGLFLGGLWAGRILFGLLIGWGLWNSAGTAAFLIRSTATTGHVVGRHHQDVPAANRGGVARFPLHVGSDGAISKDPPFLTVTSSFVEVEYRDRNGRLRRVTIPEGACWRANEEHLPVRYSDRDPHRALVNTFYGLWAKAIVLVVLGALGWAGVEFAMG